MPQSDPTGSKSTSDDFYVTRADEKALGLNPGKVSANDTSTDGYVGLSSSLTFFLNGQANAIGNPGTTQFDAVGALAHEMSEVLGRVAGLGQGSENNKYTPLDLFRSLEPGERDLKPGPGRYFSIDNTIMLSPYRRLHEVG